VLLLPVNEKWAWRTLHSFFHSFIYLYQAARPIKQHTKTLKERQKRQTQNTMKKRSETQTLRAGCSKAEPKIFAPPQTPFSGAQDGQNLIGWRWSLPLPTLQTQFGEDRCTQFRVIMVTDPHKNKPTDRTDYNTLRR